MKKKLVLLCAYCALIFWGLPLAVLAQGDLPGVAYRGHIENIGDYPLDGGWVTSPEIIGTVGQSKRMEGFEIKLTGAVPDDMEIRYNVHVQNRGWLYDEDDPTNWPKDGAYAGTRGEGLRIEAVKLELTNRDGKPVSGYSVNYRGHVENVGDLPENTASWYADGEQLGTVGSSLRLEALLVQVVKKETNRTAYTAVLGRIGELDQKNFTVASWAVLQTALSDHPVTAESSQTEVDGAVEAIQTAYDALVKKAETVVYDQPGIYGSAAQPIAGDVVVAADGVTLQNQRIEGNLTISETVGSGTATLTNVTVAGETFVRGGGANSIHINGGQYSRIVMEQTPSGQVRIVATDVAGLVVVISEAAAGETIILEGSFDSVEVNAPNMVITTQGNTQIVSLQVTAAGAGAILNLGAQTSLDKLSLNGTATVKGQGTIKSAEINANSVVFEKTPLTYMIAANVTIPPVFPTTGGGGYNPPAPVAVTGISLNQTSLDLVYPQTATLIATITPANASNKAVRFASDNEAVATVSTSGLVTPRSAGIATITAMTGDGSYSKSSTVTVTLPPLVPGIGGVPIPFAGDHPVFAITETDQYRGTISWKQNGNSLNESAVFDGKNRVMATIDLALKAPYNTDSITDNYFTVPGASCYNQSKQLKIDVYFDPGNQYRVDASGSTITAYSGPETALVIPNLLNGIEITGIGGNAFANSSITEVSLPEGLTSIADGAFLNDALTKITIGADVSITDAAALGINGASFKTFYETEVAGVARRKGNYYFADSSWHYSGHQIGQIWYDETGTMTGYTGTQTSLVVPVEISAIGPQAVANRAIETINLMAPGITINDGAFAGNLIVDITLGSGVTIGGAQALGRWTESFRNAYNANGAGNYHCYFNIVTVQPSWIYGQVVENGLAFNTDTQTINYFNGSGGTVSVPATIGGVAVKTIYQDSFRNVGLTGVVFDPASQLVTIGASAFSQNLLTSLSLPATVQTIGGSAFEACQLTSVTLSPALKTIGIGAFSQNALTEITIPDAVTAIDSQAFIGNQLTRVVIEGSGAGNLSIGYGVFQSFGSGDNEITEITLPDNVAIANDAAMGSYGAAFKAFYEDPASNNKAGGTFIYDTAAGTWSKQ